MTPTASMVFSGVAGWLSGARAADNASGPADAIARQNMLQLIHLRWIAVLGQVVTILAVHFSLGFRLPLATMMLVLLALVALNLFSLLRLKRATPLGRYDLFFALALDTLALTAQLYFSGGATNPFTTLYLLHVILGAVLLEAWATWAIVALTSFCFVMLVAFNRPIVATGLSDQAFFDMFLMGMLVGIVLDAVLLVTFVDRINANLRRHDARLAELRQRAAEETHIVRMGLLASGAAHELGTPLATLDVILGDWRRMPIFASQPDLAQELEDMRGEVQRCKTIVTGVLQSAGEARGGEVRASTLRAFLDEVVADWRATRNGEVLAYETDLIAPTPIVAESTLKQVIHNVLDNALDASPGGVRLWAGVREDRLLIEVEDDGPGFTDETLENFGKPYNSTKGRAGGGLGLFLVVNVLRKLGGRASAENVADAGARVVLDLPLSSLEIGGSRAG
ncbi:ATP-binding protein [Caulobacter segnis]|jgi:two-component system sensor histidine kinase RegB|uniref:ATP-binding protein n=1 Tax=Caulobacter segnis TaxID=88688 RepID=UPI001CC0ED7D|nr:ATP-binding protein [Caulobacter segnis]UAL09299.1 sensor histidine kinase [Caulobacter segnis]